jgi:hypothetical protein
MEDHIEETVKLDVINKILRDDCVAWENARVEFDGVKEVDYYTLVPRKGRDNSSLQYILGNLSEYLQDVLGEGVAALVAERFVVDYDLRCNINRAAEYGVNCVSLSFLVSWEIKQVVVGLIPGETKPVLALSELQTILLDCRIKDLTKFAGMVGLNVEQVRNTEAHKAGQLLRVFQNGMSGQNKLTRLVKGCLMYLDLLESGAREYENVLIQSLQYTVKDLVESLDIEDAAYVFSVNEKSSTTSAILFGMCEEYPNPTFGGCQHIKIPADGKNIYLVGYDKILGKVKVFLTPQLVWGTLVQYCERFRLGKDLESALAIACTLRENRYMTKVYLPAVLSTCDLVFPAMNRVVRGVDEKSLINSEAAVMFGRVHQMLSFVLFKDLDTSVANTSFGELNHSRDLRSIISRDLLPLMDYMEDKAVAGILKVTKDMSWLNRLDDADIKRLRKISVFEAFWVVRYPKGVFRNGVVRCLKKGVKNPIGLMQRNVFFDAYATLRREVELGSSRALGDIPNGGFNVRFDSFRRERKCEKKISFKKKSKVQSFARVGDVGTVDLNAAGRVGCPPNDHEYRAMEKLGFEESDSFSECDPNVDKPFDSGLWPDFEGWNQIVNEKDEDTSGRLSTINEDGDSEMAEPPSGWFDTEYVVPRMANGDVDLMAIFKGAALDEEGQLSTGVPAQKKTAWEEVKLTEEQYHRLAIINHTVMEAKNEKTMAEKGDPEAYVVISKEELMWSQRECARLEKIRLHTAPRGLGYTEDGENDDDGEGGDDEENSDSDESMGDVSPPQSPKGPPPPPPPPSPPKGGKPAEGGTEDPPPPPPPKETQEKEPPVSQSKGKGIEGSGTVQQAVLLEDEDIRNVGLTVQGEPVITAAPSPPSVNSRPATDLFKPSYLANKARKGAIYPPPHAKNQTPWSPAAPFGSGSKRGVGHSGVQDISAMPLDLIEGMELHDFIYGTYKMSNIQRCWKGILSCIPVYQFKKTRIGAFRTDPKLRDMLLENVVWFDGYDPTLLDRFPPVYSVLAKQIQERVSTIEEEANTPVTQEEMDSITDPRLKEIVQFRHDWTGMELSEFLQLKGVHQMMVVNDNWIRIASSLFKTKEEAARRPTATELLWLAHYLDEGGDPEEWHYVIKMGRNDAVTMNMEWQEIRGRIGEVYHVNSGWKKRYVSRWPKVEAVNKLTVGEEYTPKEGWLLREGYNKWVQIALQSIVAKQATVLIQLCVTRQFILPPQVYAILYKNNLIPMEHDVVLKEVLEQYL